MLLFALADLLDCWGRQIFEFIQDYGIDSARLLGQVVAMPNKRLFNRRTYGAQCFPRLYIPLCRAVVVEMVVPCKHSCKRWAVGLRFLSSKAVRFPVNQVVNGDMFNKMQASDFGHHIPFYRAKRLWQKAGR